MYDPRQQDVWDLYPLAKKAREERLAAEARENRLPALRTTTDLQVRMAAANTKAAIRQIGEITRLIAEIGPSDVETYGLMLDIRREYAHSVRCYIRRLFGCW